MLGVLFLWLVTVSPAVYCAARWRVRTESALPLSLGALAVLLYAGGLCGALGAAVWAAVAVGAVLYALALFFAIRQKAVKQALRAVFTPGMAVYFVLCCLFWFTNRGRMLHSWDEFSHWGYSVKVMCQYNDFATRPEAGALFATYPPAMSLLQYFAEKWNMLLGGGAFDEGLLYMVYQWALAALCMPFFSGLSFRRPVRLLLAALVPLCLPVIVFQLDAYDLIFIDTYLAAMGGFVCAYAYLYGEEKPLGMATLCVCCFSLALTKDTGILFALAGALIFALGRIAVYRQAGRDGTLGRGGCAAQGDGLPQRAIGGSKRQGLWLGFLPLGCAAIARLSWSLHITVRQAAVAQASFRQPVELGELLRVLTGATDQPWRTQTLANYVRQFFSQIFRVCFADGYISYFALFVLLSAGLLLFLYATREKDGRDPRTTVFTYTTLLTVAAYLVGMGVLYLFKFTPYEATTLAAWPRYINTAAAMELFALAAVCTHSVCRGRFSQKACAALLAVFLLLPSWYNLLDQLSGANARTSAAQQQPIAELAQDVQEKLAAQGGGPIKGVYIIAQQNKGAWLTLRYRLLPLTTSTGAWSLGEPTDAGDDETVTLSPEELRQRLLDGYDYLLIYAADEAFTETYGSLFQDPAAIRDGGLYRVTPESGLLAEVP